MTDYTASFETTWSAYPKRNGKKVGKLPAFKEWEKLSLEDQRAAYADIRDRNRAGGWEYIQDMQRYLKHRGWDDEWTGQKVTSNPDLLNIKLPSTLEMSEKAMSELDLCPHQIRGPWTWFGSPETLQPKGAVIPPCAGCGKSQQRVLG